MYIFSCAVTSFIMRFLILSTFIHCDLNETPLPMSLSRVQPVPSLSMPPPLHAPLCLFLSCCQLELELLLHYN